VRHEIRVGVADADADTALRRHAAERAGQPLDDLPPEAFELRSARARTAPA
jgi:hypothetical protein